MMFTSSRYISYPMKVNFIVWIFTVMKGQVNWLRMTVKIHQHLALLLRYLNYLLIDGYLLIHNLSWLTLHAYHWNNTSSPVIALSLACNRYFQTPLSLLASGHLESLSFIKGRKIYAICTRCQPTGLSPHRVNISGCLGLSRDDHISKKDHTYGLVS